MFFCTGMSLLAALLLWSVTRGWEPPFIYRVGDVLSQDIALVIPADEGGRSPLNELVRAGEPLTADAIGLLRKDHDHEASNLSPAHGLVRSLATLSFIFALYALCGYFIYYQDRRLLNDLRRFASLLLLVIVTTAMACWAWPYPCAPRLCRC